MHNTVLAEHIRNGEGKLLEERVAALLHEGLSPVLLTVLQKEGAAPRGAGTRALLTEHGLEGSVGGGIVEETALETARECLLDGLTRFVRCEVAEDPEEGAGHMDILCEVLHPMQAGLFDVAARVLEGADSGVWILDLSDQNAPRRMLCLAAAPQGYAADSSLDSGEALALEGGPAAGMPLPENVYVDEASCAAYLEQARRPSLFGGETPLYVEPLRPRPVLLLCGGGHVALETAVLAQALGFTVDVADCREEFVTAERFPMARNRFVVPDFEHLVEQCGVGRRHYVVIATHSHAFDLTALGQALSSHAYYIGMLGGRGKRNALFAALREQGVPDAELACVRCPIGLPIGAESPREIAVAIVAELLAARAGVLQRLRIEEERP